MESNGDYSVQVTRSGPRILAAVSARLPVKSVPAMFARHLDQVYAAAKAGQVHLDGQNVFVYRDVPEVSGKVDADFGVGATAQFAAIGNVKMITLPAGEVASTTHRGAYSQLGLAHSAVIDWCRAHGRLLTGTRWEVYGHWTSDDTPQTLVCHLLG
ncbi:MAG: GyrI-like domain-containing protein [Gemmatimonadales bacterium]